MSLNDVFLGTLRGFTQNEACLCTFAWRDIEPASTLDVDGMTIWMADTLAPTLITIQSSTAVWVQADCQILGNDTAISEYPFDQLNGLRPAESLPPYAAWSFKYPRTIIGVRPGSKRIPGIAESDQTDGVCVNTMLSLLDAVADFLGEHHSIGDGEIVPCVVSRYVNNQLRDEPLVMNVNSCQYVGIGTQNTRKFRR